MAGEENYGEATYDLAIADISSDQNAANVTEIRAEQMKKNAMFLHFNQIRVIVMP